MSEHNHTGLDEAASVASNTMQAVRTGRAISAAAKGAAAGGPYGAAIGAALSARKHIGKIAAAALVLLALPLLFILLLPGIIFGSLTDSGVSGAAGRPILNDNAAITENMNQAAFAINQILGEGIENKPFFVLRNIELHLDIPLSVCHAPPPFFIRVWDYPNKQF